MENHINPLENKTFIVPSNILVNLKLLIRKYPNENIKRIQFIVNSKGSIRYEHIKRIKNFFDHYDGKETDLKFILNGGNEMKKWANNELKKNINISNRSKEAKSILGFENSFRGERNDFSITTEPEKLYTPKLNTKNGDIAMAYESKNLKELNIFLNKINEIIDIVEKK